MNYSKKDIYVLGTGLSHDGSACLLKNGKICAAIEKERINRLKHSGGNDLLAIKYCLEQAGITINDVELIVQHAPSGIFLEDNSFFMGPRAWPAGSGIPIVTISHHMAHAYYAIGISPFEEAAVFVLDGAGSNFNHCMDLGNGIIGEKNITKELEHLYIEKDSLYLYQNGQVTTKYKDFSPIGHHETRYPLVPFMLLHSIGGFYSSASAYCFGSYFDTGKLMGLAPYGKPGVYDKPIFECKEGRVLVIYGDHLEEFMRPAWRKDELKTDFQYYANIAYWVQKETERAIEYLITARKELVPVENLFYTGGVALNAVANAILRKKRPFENIFLTPAAGDNGIAVGCAYYGWLEVLKGKREMHNGNSCFGKTYSDVEIQRALSRFISPVKRNYAIFIDALFKNISHFANQSAIANNRYLIQFLIPEVGNYSVLFEEGSIHIDNKHDYSGHADCMLIADASTFILSVNNYMHLMQAVEDKKAILNGDISNFPKFVDLDNLFLKVKELIKENPEFEWVCFERSDNVIKSVAELLAAGKIIGWFQGGSEFGPRALGNRSILADPRRKGIRQFINNRIKFREDFRPFAPAVMLEHVSEYFDFSGESPYMILTAQVREEWKDKIPDVVHVDNSSRIQTVTEHSNKMFYELLKEFKRLTGLPILLNTSFNKKGMPIIEKPDEALAFFFECELDYLIIHDFIISRNKRPVENREDQPYTKSSVSI